MRKGKEVRRGLFLISSLCLCASAVGSPACAGPAVRLTGGRFEVTELAPTDLERSKKDGRQAERWQELFTVRVATPADAPPMLGTYRVDGAVLRFEPRFPLVPGV